MLPGDLEIIFPEAPVISAPIQESEKRLDKRLLKKLQPDQLAGVLALVVPAECLHEINGMLPDVLGKIELPVLPVRFQCQAGIDGLDLLAGDDLAGADQRVVLLDPVHPDPGFPFATNAARASPALLAAAIFSSGNMLSSLLMQLRRDFRARSWIFEYGFSRSIE